MQVAFPFRVDGRRRTALASDEDHIRQMIELVLFTAPGERVNRPEFGSGAQQLLFGPSSPELAPTLQCVVQGALQQWLGDRIRVEAVEVSSEDNRLQVLVQYLLVRNDERRVVAFEREVGL